MKKALILFAMAALALLAFPQGATRAADNTVTIKMTAQNGSGQDGVATITDLGNGQIKVVLNIKSVGPDAQPAHIHMGSCANLNPKPQYPLTSVVNGMSETTVNASFASVTAGTMAINVHKSAAEVSTYVSCGDISTANMGSPSPGVGPAAGPAVPSGLVVQMHAQNGSGEDGTATLTQMSDGHLQVVLKLGNAPAEAQPAHIHPGSCANLNPKPQYPLTSAMGGASTTDVAVNLSDLLKGTYAINVHKSAAEVSTYVSCGDIVDMSMGGGTPTLIAPAPTPAPVGMPATGNGQETYLLAGLALLALTLTGAGLRLARTRA